MTGVPLVVLDACVLAAFSLCDTLLRLAEPPRLYGPKWSEEIIRETTRTLESKLGWPSSLAAYLQAELRAHFGEAWISGYEALIPRMTNEEKDRHVLAAAAHGKAPFIVTFNLRHFGREHLEPWGIRALHPQSFLIEIFRQEQSLVMTKLEQQAADRWRTLRELLDILSATCRTSWRSFRLQSQENRARYDEERRISPL
ncbi:MAG: PIN domain-containing protein [Acidobacteria bacterium]|nr:PIN domain-containing protein [Acidobacteriota bacterium]